MNAFEFYLPQVAGQPTPLVQVPPPDNWQSLMTELSFENNSPSAVLNATKLVWKSSNAEFLNDWAKTGLMGGVGLFEGVPLQIKLCQSQEIIFDGIIDLSDPETKWTCDIVACKIRDKQIDMVTTLFESISFGFLATPTSNGGAGIIDPRPQSQGGDYVTIPYQRNNVPDYTEFFIVGLAIYNIAEKTYDVSQKLTGLVSGALAASAALSTGALALAIAEIIFYVLYIALMILVILAMLKAAFNYLVSPVMTKFGMYAVDLMERACQYFGIQFQSSILQSYPFNKLVIMPQKMAWINNQSFVRTLFQGIAGGSTVANRMEYDDLYNYLNGGMAYGYYDGTCADFVRSMEETFNAKAKIIINSNGDPVLHFERWDYIYNIANYQLPNVSDQAPFNSEGFLNTTGFSESAFMTNASMIPANYMVRYSLDEQDRNTYNYYDGTMCYATTRPIVTNVARNQTLQNLKEANIRYAQAFRKDKLTAVEEALQPLWYAASLLTNAVISGVNGINSVINSVLSLIPNAPALPTVSNGGLTFMPAQPPFAQLGHLLITGDITGVPKMFIAGNNVTFNNYYDFQSHIVTGVSIHANNKDIIGARYLMKNFHFSNLPLTTVPPAPYNQPYVAGAAYFNQWLIYKDIEIPLCCEEYQLIKNNNIIKTFNGKFARVDSLRWNVFKGTARIDYRVNMKYTNNLKLTYVIDGAETTQTL